MKLGFNIDHVATLRNARNEGYPNLIVAAEVAKNAGAHQITAHLREDRRHIKDQDIIDLKTKVQLPLNMEMATTDEMLKIALEVKPYSVCLVPEKREELTTEGGLDVANLLLDLQPKIDLLNNAKIKPVLFIDANPKQVEAAIKLGAFGVEFNTGTYANLAGKLQEEEANNIAKMAKIATDNKLEAHAGHGLNYDNVINIAKISAINELNIGHFLVSNAIFIGLSQSIQKMLEIINNARS
ncbi:pyridoxine 5'-phosphate synthase [Rickettsiales bacterium LUAb2]